MNPRLWLVLALVGLAVFSQSLLAQGPPPSDPQAVNLASQSINALTHGSSISDVTLTGTATWNGGPDIATATLRALGTDESRMDLALGSGMRTEIRDAQTGTQLGQWTNPDGAFGDIAFQNCQTDAAWFFPGLSSLAMGPNIVLSYIGPETRDGHSVQHIQAYTYHPTSPPGLSMQQLSEIDFYLDTATLLPVAATFNAHPDNDATTNLLVEIGFSGYQTISGILVPTHIQRSQQGNVTADIVVSAAAFNSGLPLSLFAIN